MSFFFAGGGERENQRSQPSTPQSEYSYVPQTRGSQREGYEGAEQSSRAFGVGSDGYHKDCDPAGFSRNGGGVTNKSVEYFKWYLGTLQNWLEGKNPFLTKVFVSHITILETCLKGRLAAKKKEAEGGDEGHDYVIHVILFHVFFLNVVQCLERPRFYFDIFDDLQVEKSALGQKYNEGSICARLYETLRNTYKANVSRFNLYNMYFELSTTSKSGLVNYTTDIKKLVETFEKSNPDGTKLEDIFGSIFASWAIVT